MDDTASHGEPRLASDEVRHTLTVREVEAELARNQVLRSRRTIIRLCQSGAFDAIKLPGPSGDEWLIAPASVPKVIGDLRQHDAQQERRSAPRHATSDPGAPENVPQFNADTASRGEPRPAMSQPAQQGTTATEPATASHGTPADEAIFEHPYVKRLEERADRFEKKYDGLVLRFEEREARHRKDMLELQRMITVAQSQTLANFLLKARGDTVDAEATEVPRDPLADAS